MSWSRLTDREGRLPLSKACVRRIGDPELALFLAVCMEETARVRGSFVRSFRGARPWSEVLPVSQRKCRSLVHTVFDAGPTDIHPDLDIIQKHSSRSGALHNVYNMYCAEVLTAWIRLLEEAPTKPGRLVPGRFGWSGDVSEWKKRMTERLVSSGVLHAIPEQVVYAMLDISLEDALMRVQTGAMGHLDDYSGALTEFVFKRYSGEALSSVRINYAVYDRFWAALRVFAIFRARTVCADQKAALRNRARKTGVVLGKIRQAGITPEEYAERLLRWCDGQGVGLDFSRVLDPPPYVLS